MVRWFAKKFVLKQLNQMLAGIKDNGKAEQYMMKIQSVMQFLANVLEYVQDGEIDDAEAECLVGQAKELFK